jgi:RNA polymerase sigma-70 factor, ECF subfamily
MDESERNAFDREVFVRMVEEYADRVYNVALRITGNPADAEDAMQSAFESAYREWPHFRGQARPTTWLYRIAVNTALQRVRSRHPSDYLSDLPDEGEVRDWSASVVELAERSEFHAVLYDGLSQLPPDFRAVLVLRDIDGLSAAEAAEALEITVQALKSRLHRARALLRAQLADYFNQL